MPLPHPSRQSSSTALYGFLLAILPRLNISRSPHFFSGVASCPLQRQRQNVGPKAEQYRTAIADSRKKIAGEGGFFAGQKRGGVGQL